MSLIEKIARSYRSWRETISALGAHEKPMQIAFEAGYRAAPTAMPEGFGGDGVQEVDAAEQAEAFGKAYRAEQLSSYGCGGVVQCTYPHDGNCVCFNNTLARHRSTAAAAERARIVAWLRGLAHESQRKVAAPIADAIERGEV